jgi:histidine triad (HIT) family protein
MRDESCLFCRIVSRAVPAQIVAETDSLLAFNDINPQAPTHILIVPTEHIRTLADASERQTELLGRCVQFANRLAKERTLVEDGYRLVVNCGAQAGQSVWHLHWHLLGGRPFRWPPG